MDKRDLFIIPNWTSSFSSERCNLLYNIIVIATDQMAHCILGIHGPVHNGSDIPPHGFRSFCHDLYTGEVHRTTGILRYRGGFCLQ